MGRLRTMNTLTRGALLAGAGIALTLSAACSPPNKGGSAKFDSSDAKPASLEQLASKTGCKLLPGTKAKELNQGACQTSSGRYTLVSFASQAGQDAWLTEAKNWGGDYLVGNRWVVVSTPKTLETLKAKLGGDIQAGDNHGSSEHSGHEAGGDTGGSGY